MVGILVHGDNHFIVRGPLPDRDVARALIRHWTIIQIGATTPPSLEKWHISTKEFREDLEWAVIVPEFGCRVWLSEFGCQSLVVRRDWNFVGNAAGAH